MGTKNNPGVFDCHDKADPDEPRFTLLGRDPFTPVMLELWAEMREDAGDDPERVKEARVLAHEARAWLTKIGRIEARPQLVLLGSGERLDVLKGRV